VAVVAPSALGPYFPLDFRYKNTSSTYTVNNNTWNSRIAIHNILWHIIYVCVSCGYYLFRSFYGILEGYIIFCWKKHLVTFPFSHWIMTPTDILL
jgi:uncharacterized membrane protein YagU involved in acid resistance